MKNDLKFALSFYLLLDAFPTHVHIKHLNIKDANDALHFDDGNENINESALIKFTMTC